MFEEVERKFLVVGDDWRKGVRGVFCRQGYLFAADDCSVRVRVAAGKANLTIKGRKVGLTCLEYEYDIPPEDADDLMDRFCTKPFVEKTRYTLDYGGLTWVIDEFEGDNKGLILAEVELTREEQIIELPEWVGLEVSLNPKYLNVNLMKHPYGRWSEEIAQRNQD